jgi:hypothetical protein
VKKSFSNLASYVAVGLALQYVMGIMGCSSDAPGKGVPSDVAKNGTLQMALETVSASGKVYRLRFATFFVNGLGSGPFAVGGGAAGAAFGAAPSQGSMDGGFGVGGGTAGGGFGAQGSMDGGFGFGGFIGAGGFSSSGGTFGTGGSSFPPSTSTVVLNSEDNPTSPVLETFLAPGSYDIQLLDGWFVEQVDDLLHTSAPVDATLLSSSFQFFDIQSNQETVTSFDFEVDGQRITFGPPGRLIVKIGVQERNGAATCGNGVVEGNESCDGADLRGNTCSTVTMGTQPGGFLFCSPFCTFDTSACQGGGTGGFGGGAGGVFGVDAGAGGATPVPVEAGSFGGNAP